MPTEEVQGAKYERAIWSIRGMNGITVDVYCVLDAFKVTDQAVGHAVKKLLCAGLRGKGSRLDDLRGAAEAIQRAIKIEQQKAAAEAVSQ